MKASGGRLAWGPYLLVLAGAATGLGAIALGVRLAAGGAIIGSALVVGALIRLNVSDSRAGLLTVRTRKVDTLVMAGLGGALVVGSLLLLVHLHNT
ncbi:DUF3017 domain-containing protein [Microbispora sp. RL4-1S]|uniref:DUF3017 domain-containing protein n=1 Tax=Microbispora oryzae TaxID=2806554 RepID=A0A940WH92_9ACTN|nr:DUF3017 domain-containing protein [Microbispora oryzae]MBP2704768.1 DUF3017 domain-containing protein [Microbispora oryzae]